MALDASPLAAEHQQVFPLSTRRLIADLARYPFPQGAEGDHPHMTLLPQQRQSGVPAEVHSIPLNKFASLATQTKPVLIEGTTPECAHQVKRRPSRRWEADERHDSQGQPPTTPGQTAGLMATSGLPPPAGGLS